MIRAERIARALGAARREGRGWRCRCPLHGGNSLVLRDGSHGRLLLRCWGGGCDPRDLLAELWRRGLLGGAGFTAEPPRHDPADRHDRERRIGAAYRIWDAAREARGTPVVAYLARRGISAPSHHLGRS